MTDIKVVVPSDINTTAGGLKFEGRKWSVDIDNETIKRKGNKLYAVPPKQIEFATEAEMDKGENSPKDKAVSAYEYQKDVRCDSSGTYDVFVGGNAGESAGKYFNTFVGFRSGSDSKVVSAVFLGAGAGVGAGDGATSQIAIGSNAGRGVKSERSFLIGGQLVDSDWGAHTENQENVNVIGYFATPRMQESNYFQLGNTSTQNIYTSATYNGKGFNKTSDMRSKRVIQRLSTLDNGISVYLFQYLDNGMTSVGWMAQEVEELLRDKGYDEQIIEIAIPRSHDVDWQATIGKFQDDIGSVVKSWTDAQALYNRLVAQYLTENGITESREEFMQNMEIYFEDKEKNPPAEVTPENAKREEVYNHLKAKDLNNYLTYADDIRRIDESVVNNLL